MPGKSIKHYLLISWMVSILVAVASSAILAFGISYLDYSNYRESAESALKEDAKSIARRIAAEILLKENGRTSAVLANLKSEYHLSDLHVESAVRPDTSDNNIRVRVEIPGVTPASAIWVSKQGKPLAGFINTRNFILALVPILALALVGFLIQRRLLRKFILHPVESLAETSTGTRDVKPYWPTEIKTIAHELSESFSAREQAIFGRLARGLIHDIRTKINSIDIAHQLVTETDPDSTERQTRLNKLDTACDRNIPKIRELINLSLDGSREIVIKPRLTDLSETILQSVDGLRELIDLKEIQVSTSFPNDTALPHDPLQLERVFTNLIKNAVDAVDEKNSAHKQISIRSESIPQGLRVTIEDSGSGFKDINQIFRPFKTTKTHGYGLGLFVSKKIVESHGGQLVAEPSELLGGAKFTLTFKESEVIV